MTNLPSVYQEFIHLSRYSRWIPEKKRRETWQETVARYFDFFEEHLKEYCNYKLKKELRQELETAVLNLEVMPSMRCLMTAGEALKREGVAAFNCSYAVIDNPRAFDEILYILMNGTGVGFSVEQQYVSKLPIVADVFYDTDTTIVVADSKLGWAKAFKELLSMLWVGQVPKWDTTRVRPAGTPLKTFGGRASGPAPLEALFKFCVKTFKGASGRRLTCLECHDIVCKIADIVVVGGVRRSALISLSDLGDERIRHAKSGAWWQDNSQRALANNSVAYKEPPDVGTFMAEWKSLYDSKSGERGIFNRQAATNQVKKLGRREVEHEWGTNPCSEIILRPNQFCNLSEVVVRTDDTKESLLRKVRLATILGTFQSSITHFRYLSKSWIKNTSEERLLGVSLTGIMDNPILNGSVQVENLPEILSAMRKQSVETNLEFSKLLKIEPSAAITCVKPSGTVSQLVDSASGIHARFAEYYIRTVRSDKKDPLCKFMREKGFKWEPCVMKPDSTVIFSFPMKAPNQSVFRQDVHAIDQLNFWLTYQRHWCEHKPSITVYVKEHEWMEVGSWVWKHFNEISGVSFLPHMDHVYKQAPYQDCTKEQYEDLLASMPENIDWSQLSAFEDEDTTVGAQELACTGNSCEIA